MRFEVGNKIWTFFKNILEMDYMNHLELLGMSLHSRDLGMNSHSFLSNYIFQIFGSHFKVPFRQFSTVPLIKDTSIQSAL